MRVFKRARDVLIAIGLALLCAVLAALLTHYFSFVANLENIARDIRLANAPPRPQHPDIVVVAINEDTLAGFPYRSPVDRAFLAGLLKTLEAKGARAIALDVLLDQPTEPDKDRLLYDTLRALRVPLAISYTHTPGIVNAEQLRYLEDFVPPELRAFANLGSDPFDGTVRWMLSGEDDARTPKSLPRKLAERVGIPTPRQQLEIAWRARPDAHTPAFAQYPAQGVQWLPDDWIRGRIVLVGAVLSLTDRHRTPYAVIDDGDDGRMPGVVVQAHSTAQLLEGVHQLRPEGGFSLLITLAFALIGAGIGLLKRGLVVSVFGGVLVLMLWWWAAIAGHRYGMPLVPLVAPALSLTLTVWMLDEVLGSRERRARQFVQGAFSRYVSPAVVEQLVERAEALSISGKRVEATFLFTDIADFTTLSETLGTEALSDLLNAYLDGACAVVLKHGGTIDKFIGDAIMVMFNAPIAQPDHSARALRCALELDAFAQAFRAEQATRGITLGATRIGLHSGVATVGNFGSQQRMEYTALGDVVNTASRVEGANKFFGTRVCCTETVAQGCPAGALRPLGAVQLKGKRETLQLFEPLTEQQQSDPAIQAFVAAWPQLEQGGEAAQSVIEQLAQQYPNDALIALYRQRAELGALGRPIVFGEK